MGWRIENYPTELYIADSNGNSNFYEKSGLKVSSSDKNIVITNGSTTIFNENPSVIDSPAINGVDDLVKEIDSYLISNPSGLFSGGWADYNDFATTGTPITITGGAGLTTLTNDTLGAYTNETKLPFGVAKLWDASTSKLDLTGMSVGDVIDIRITIQVVVASTNTEISGALVMGSGGSSFEVPFLNALNYKATGTYSLAKYVGFYIGSEDVLNNGGYIKIQSDTTCTVIVDGWFIKAVKVGSV